MCVYSIYIQIYTHTYVDVEYCSLIDYLLIAATFCRLLAACQEPTKKTHMGVGIMRPTIVDFCLVSWIFV